MADEEVTDLTENEESADAGKGKKKEKAPKEKKEKVKKEKGEKGEKGGAGSVILIMVLVLIILIGGFSAALFFDVFSAREIIADVVTEPLLDVIIWLDPGFSSIRQRLVIEEEAQIRRLEERREEFEIREEDIVLREGILNTREQLLERRSFELDRREEQIIAMYERTIPIYRREDRTEQEIADMNSLSRTYTQMSPDTAADILVRLYDPRDVAAILYYMSERNAATILAAMDPAYAANITEILLYN